jgi:hypothetical protein
MAGKSAVGAIVTQRGAHSHRMTQVTYGLLHIAVHNLNITQPEARVPECQSANQGGRTIPPPVFEDLCEAVL